MPCKQGFSRYCLDVMVYICVHTLPLLTPSGHTQEEVRGELVASCSASVRDKLLRKLHSVTGLVILIHV